MPMPDEALRRGETLVAAGRYREAVRVLSDVADVDTPNWRLQCALAEALVQTGDFKAALKTARLAEQLQPRSPRVLQMLAEAQLALNRPAEADETTKRIIELAPHSAAGYDLRGRIAMRQKRYADAEVHFKEALRLEPANWALNNNLGVALRHQKRDQEAIKAFAKAAAANPNARVVRRNLFGATSVYIAAGGLFVVLLGLRMLPRFASWLHQPLATVSVVFYGSLVLAVGARWLWGRHRLRQLSPEVARLYHQDWMRERSVQLVRTVFRTVPVMAVVLAVIWLGLTQNVGFLPWIVAGGVFVVIWWFAWRPLWRRLVTTLGRLTRQVR
jgi:Flp pilus assembly protein TadD